MAGVASAAIVSGELIIGLDDGQIIRAGYVQGPQGLTGDRGPMGSTGQPGRDGNGVLHGAGVPTFEDGKDGDFFIDTKVMKFYGPKVGGKWGSGVPLLPKDRGGKLPSGMRTDGAAGSSRAFAAAMGGAGGGTVVTGGGGGAGETIFGHNKPLTAATLIQVATDQDGDAMIVDIYAESAQGARLVEVAVMRDSAKNTGYSEVYEVRTGTIVPTLTFQAINDVGGKLALTVQSDVNLIVLRGRVMYI